MAAPSSPINVQATAGGYTPATGFSSGGLGLVSCTWVPGDPEDAITSFTVSISSGGSLTLPVPPGAIQPQLSCIFTGLTLGHAVTVQVTAQNSDGTSLASTPSNVVVPKLLPGSTVNDIYAIIAQMWNDYYSNSISPIPCFAIGGQSINNNVSPPQIVFIPRRSTWGGPTMLGNGITTPRQIWDRRVVVEAHIWGSQYNSTDPQQDSIANFGSAEQLTHNLAASIHRIFYGTQIEESDRYLDSSNATTVMGADMVLDITLLIPVQDYPPQVSTIGTFTSLPITEEFLSS